MTMSSISQTLAQCSKARPVLRPILEAFEPLYSARQDLAEKLAPLLEEAGLAILKKPEGKPILLDKIPTGLARFAKLAALELLPLLFEQKAVAPHRKGLEALFLDEENATDLEGLIAATLADNGEAFFGIAKKYGVEAGILEFASSFVVSAVLRALAASLKNVDFTDWHKGTCPVCGSRPIIAWLDRKPLAEANEFLVDGGGRKWLHCGVCGTDWHFVRGVCPACGAQGKEAMRILGEEDKMHERIDWCEVCHSYLPQIDLRQLIDTPDMDAMALGMVHLDIVAAEKELVPLKASFWNMF